MADDGEEVVAVPPFNFAMVHRGVYRSGYPTKKNFAFLRRLGIRTVVYLCPEPYPEANRKFLRSIGARLMQFGLAGNKEPYVDIPDESLVVTSALKIVSDPANHPVLIHCNKGKHRTGCVVGCFRRTQRWALTSVVEEYRRYSAPKNRFMDEQFIELWNPRMMELPPSCLIRPMSEDAGGDRDEWQRLREDLARLLPKAPEQ